MIACRMALDGLLLLSEDMWIHGRCMRLSGSRASERGGVGRVLCGIVS